MRFLLTILILAGSLFMGSCIKCDDPTDTECDNYDPCHGLKVPDASFTCYSPQGYSTWRDLGWYDKLIKTDTVSRSIYLVANEEDVEYLWLIGAETYTTKDVSIDFTGTGVEAGAQIPITLITKWEPDTACHPNDNGLDTSTRHITVAYSKLNDYIPIYPKAGEKWEFEVLNNMHDFIPDTFSMLTIVEDPETDPARIYIYYSNLPKGFKRRAKYTDLRNAPVGEGYMVGRYNDFDHPQYIPKHIVGIYFINSNTYKFRIESFEINNPNSDTLRATFLAKKLN